MRDTSLLRRRFHTALACLPLAAGLGCGEAGTAAQPAPAGPAAPSAPAAASALPSAPAAVSTQPLASAALASSYPARTGQDPFDPDGIEEEGCPNGDWCAPASVAQKVAATNATLELGCPTRLMGSATKKTKLEERQFKGLSLNPMMQGRLRKIATAELRAATGDDQQCCYHWFDYCSGRPLLDDQLASVRAPLRPGDTWLLGHVPEASLDRLPPTTRRALASFWQDDARSEHASVAAFARATLELLAVGAPPELLAASQQASLDEIRHAQTCFTLAALYLDLPAEPGPLPMLAPRDGGLVALACNTFIEGCVGETIAALAALRAARGCQIAPVQAALLGIAEDETRHAELAWATLAFAVQRGGPEVVLAVRRLADQLYHPDHSDHSNHSDHPDHSDHPLASEHDPLPPALLAAHGRLCPATLAQTRRDAWHDILGPTLDLVLGDRPATAPPDRSLS